MDVCYPIINFPLQTNIKGYLSNFNACSYLFAMPFGIWKVDQLSLFAKFKPLVKVALQRLLTMSRVFRIVHFRSIFTTKVEEFVWRRKQSFLRHEWQPENRIFIQGAYIIYSHDNTNHKQKVNLSLAWRQNSLSNFERGKRVREAKRGNLSFIFFWGGGRLLVFDGQLQLVQYIHDDSLFISNFFLERAGGLLLPLCSPKYLR